MNKKNYFGLAKNVLKIASLCFIPFVFATCDVGLGESVDTGAPSLSISYPPEGAVVRDWFRLAGSCSDDKGVSRVAVTLTNTSTNQSFGPYNATISGGVSWYIDLNKPSKTTDDNGNVTSVSYGFPDGTYSLNIMVYDDSGHSSGPFSRSFDIDNTNPILIITSPGSTTTAKTYGSNLRISGTVAESHGISQMTLSIYESDGTTLNGEYTIDENIDTSDGCAIDFARYVYEGTSQINKNYEAIYGTVATENGKVSSSNTARPFKTGITLADTAYTYQSPDSGSATEKVGNTTTVVYLNSDVYTTLMGTGNSGLGLTAARIIGNMNGKYTDRYEALGSKDDGTYYSVKEFLEKYAKDTTDSSNYLVFSLNPAARPTYTINSAKTISQTGAGAVTKETADNFFVTQLSSSSTVIANVSPSTESSINIKESDFALWIRQIKDEDYTTGFDAAVTTLESTVYGGGTPAGWTQIWQGTDSTPSDSLFTITSDSLGSKVTAGSYYLIAVTGQDVEGANLIHDNVYGFKGIVSGNPPEITVNPITVSGEEVALSGAYFNTSDLFSLSGTVKSDTGNELQSVKITITAVDEENKNSPLSTSNGSGNFTTLTKEIDLSAKHSTEESFGSFKLSDFENSSGFVAAANSGKTYKYSVTITAENLGNSGKESFDFYVDTLKPTVSITSIEPAVEGSDFDTDTATSTNTYINGTVSIRAGIEDTHLSEVFYQVGSGEWQSLGTGTSQKIEIDTTDAAYTDGQPFVLTVKAVDKAGNEKTYSSNEFCKETYFEDQSGTFSYTIKQESDKPRINLTNVDDTISSTEKLLESSDNLFDLATKDSITGTIKDDDGVKTVKIYINDSLKETYNITGTKTSYSLKYSLKGMSQGVYKVAVEAFDKTYDETNESTKAYRTAKTSEFYISIDEKAPEITEDGIGASTVTKNSEITLSGTASDTNGLYDSDSATAGAQGAVTIEAFKSGVANAVKTLSADVGTDNKWSQTFVVGSDNSAAENYLADGSYSFTITVKDVAGRTTAITRTAVIDTTKPAFGTKAAGSSNTSDVAPYVTTTVGGTVSGVSWYNSSSLALAGTASDANGIASVQYATYTGDWSEDNADSLTWAALASSTVTATTPTVSFSGTASDLAHGITKIALKVTDNAGNFAYDTSLGAFNIDTEEPKLVSQTKSGSSDTYRVLVNGDTYITEEDNTVLSNGDADITFKMIVNDVLSSGSTGGKSGINKDKVYISLGKLTTDLSGSSTGVTTTSSTQNDDGSYTVEFTIAKANIVNGAVYARIYDLAGNYTDETLFSISRDSTPPVLQSYTLVDNAENYTAYTKDKTTYYLHNNDSHTFTISGVSTDNRSVKRTDITIEDSKGHSLTSTGENPTLTLDNEKDASEWSYTFSLADFDADTDATITILVTDEAGNVHTSATGKTDFGKLTVKFDNTAPAGVHEKDFKDKDYRFLLGENGGKYLPGTYGNATTIMVRGYMTETGSGIEQIYYKVMQSAPTAQDAADFLADYANLKTGSFAPLSTEGTISVSTNKDANTKETKSVTYNYQNSISSFQSGKNYLIIVGVDNVGNAKLDTTTYTYTNSSNESVSVEGCYSINVDQKAPELTSDITENVLTNGAADITITGTATDKGDNDTDIAGIDSVVVSVEVNGTTYSSSDTSPKITVTTESTNTSDSSDMTGVKWTATLSKDIFSASTLTSGSFTVYAQATDKAGAGNSTKISVATIVVDKEKPTLAVSSAYSTALIATTDNSATTNESAAKTAINGNTTFAGTANDNNSLASVKAYYSTTSKTSTIDEKTSENTSGKDILIGSADTSNLYSWTFAKEVSKLNSEDGTITVLGETSDGTDQTLYVKFVVEDKAGNSNTYVYQYNISPAADKPTINVANITANNGTLKYDTTLTGTVSDDDEISSGCVFKVYEIYGKESDADKQLAANAPATVSAWQSYNSKGTLEFNSTNGEWKYTLQDTEDGDKTLYFYFKDAEGTEFWNAYSVNTTTITNNVFFQPKLTFKGNADSTYDSKNAVTFKTDSESPSVKGMKVQAYDSSEVANGSAESASTALILGGTEKRYGSLVITADDANGIALMYIDVTDDGDGSAFEAKHLVTDATELAKSAYADSKRTATYTASGSMAAATDSATTYIWTTDKIDFADAVGPITVAVTVYDGSELKGNGSFTFSIDNKAPTVKVTSPSSDDENTGTIVIIGSATDEGGSDVAGVEWLIPTQTQRNTTTDAALLAAASSTGETLGLWHDNLTTGKTYTSWGFTFNEEDETKDSNDKYIYRMTTYDYKDATDYTSAYDSTQDIYTIPVYIKASDTLGNTTIYRGYTLKHNPEADRPVITFSYPTVSDYDNYDSETGESNGYVTLGNTIRLTGTVEIPSGTTSPKAVFVQVANANSSIDWSDSEMAALTGTVITGTDNIASASGVSALQGLTQNATWGIQATRKNTSWSLNINAGGVLNAEKIKTSELGANALNGNDTNNIAVRAFGVNADGKVGSYSTVYYLHIDDKSPKYTAELKQFATTPDSDSSFQTQNTSATNITATKEYSSGMYIKNTSAENWFLVVSVTDDTGLDFVSKDGDTSTYYKYEVSGTAGTSDAAQMYIAVPLSTTTGEYEYGMTIQDKDAVGHTIQPSYTIRVDNTAPTVGTLKWNGSTFSTSSSARTDIADENYVFSLSATSDDDGAVSSGIERIIYYFMRSSDLKDKDGTTSANMLLDPVITSGQDDSKISTPTAQSIGGYTLYGKSVTGGTTSISDENSGVYDTFTLSSLSSDTHIRKGGMIYIGGVIRSITDYDSSTGKVTFDPSLGTSATSASITKAFFPYALSVDHSGESMSDFSSNPFVFKNESDDGDGMVESFVTSGTSASWEATVHTTNIPDGPARIVVLALDKAGNLSQKIVRVNITNNAPKIAKLYLGTDLNGDGKYSQETTDAGVEIKEFEQINVLGAKGDVQSSVIMDSKSYMSSKKPFKLIEGLAVVAEIVGGNNGIGMIYTSDATSNIDGSNLTAATGTVISSVATSKGTTTTNDDGDVTARSGTVTSTTSGSKISATLDMATSLVTTSAQSTLNIDGTSNLYAFVVTSGLPTTNATGVPMQFTFWDKTEGTTQGTDSQHCEIAVSDIEVAVEDKTAPTAVIQPFYWESSYDTSGNEVITSSIYYDDSGNRLGHIDLGQFRTDSVGIPAVSGVIKIEGTAFDDQRLDSVALSINSTTLATSTYTPSTSTWSEVGTLTTAAPYKLTVENVSFSQSGHTAKWTLLVDTASSTTKFANGDSNIVKVTSTQARTSAKTSTPGTKQTGLKSGTAYAYDSTDTSLADSHYWDETYFTGYYKMSVVPYITSITRYNASGTAVSTIADSNMNRSKLGHYPVSEGEVLAVYGFNFGTKPTVYVGNSEVYATGTTAITSTNSTISGVGSFTFTVPAHSGNISVENSTTSLNNSNTDPAISGNTKPSSDTTKNYNLEEVTMKGSSTTFYVDDDRYLAVWNLGNYFTGTGSGAEVQKPVMAADSSGNLYASWAAQSNSNVVFSHGMTASPNAIFRSYDQPAESTGLAIDQKSGTTAGMVTFIAEQQGAGGTFSSHALSSAAMVGGAGMIQLDKDNINKDSSTFGSGLIVNVPNNPLNTLDSKSNSAANKTSYYNLASYDANRRLGSFSSPRSARYGNYMHSIWYDSVTEGLKYSLVYLNDSYDKVAKYNQNSGAVVGWVVLDGGYTGQDRLHNFSYGTGGAAANNKLFDNWNAQVTTTATKYQYAQYETDYFAGVKSVTAGDNYTDVFFNNDTSISCAVGDTAAILCNAKGNYHIQIVKCTYALNDRFRFSGTLDSEFMSGSAYDTDNMTITVYKGDYNVVNKDNNQSSSAGISADIDVDSNGNPVVAYIDTTNSELRVAYLVSGKSGADAKVASNWTRQIVPNTTCAGEVSLRVDGNNNIHILYQNEDGYLCYEFGTPSGNSYTFNKPEIVDTTGSMNYGSISLKYTSDGYVPVASYVNKAGTAHGLKYAYRKSVPASDTTAKASTLLNDNWDFMIIPMIKGSNHYVTSENRVSVEAYKSGWASNTKETVLQNQITANDTTKTATPATVQAVVAYKSKQFETAYLREEK